MDSWFHEICLRFADRTAFIYEDRQWSYAECGQQTQLYIEELQKQGVQAGQHCAVVAPNSPQGVCMLFALLAVQAEVFPCDANACKEDDPATTNYDWVIQFCDGYWQFDALKPEERKHEVEPGIGFHTSGTTGVPRTVSHRFSRLVEGYRSKPERRLVFIALMGFDHIGGMDVLLRSLLHGATLVIPVSTDPHVVATQINRHGVTVLAATPSYIRFLIMAQQDNGREFPSIEYLSYGAEPMPQDLLLRICQRFPQASVLQTYGTTETGVIQTQSKARDSLYFRIVDPLVEYRIEAQELLLKTPTTQDAMGDQWYATGDLVTIDDEGYIKIIGRLQERINVGGEKVLPGEVEESLRRIEGIRDCLVYGEPHSLMGNIIVADIVLEGTSTPSTAEWLRTLRMSCRGRLEPFKIPQKVNLVNQIEHTSRLKRKRPLAV